MRLGPYLLGPNDTPESGIYTGDARELALAIPDESVDLIFTDPVYQNIDDYRWLAETAARVLKPNSSCLALCGHEHLAKIISAMEKYLTYHWVCCLWQPGQSGLIWYKSIMAKWKPAVWFSKGVPTSHVRRWFMDGVEGVQSKSFHRWGQPIAWARWIDRIDARLIWEPFAGGGTVPAVCKMLGRRYLAFEIDPATAQDARDRVQQTQPPLFVPEPQQMELCEVMP